MFDRILYRIYRWANVKVLGIPRYILYSMLIAGIALLAINRYMAHSMKNDPPKEISIDEKRN